MTAEEGECGEAPPLSEDEEEGECTAAEIRSCEDGDDDADDAVVVEDRE